MNLRPFVALLLCFLSASQAGEALTGRGSLMDHGPFVSAAISDVVAPHFRDIFPKPGNANIACKGIAIRLGHGAHVCFDTDLMRMAFGWQQPENASGPNAGLIVKNTMLAETKGVLNPYIAGTLRFSTKMGPGWSTTPDFKDPRNYGFGPLPKEMAHYKGLYLSGDKVILKYTVGGVEILELPGALEIGERVIFTRTFHIAKSATPLVLRICDYDAKRDANVRVNADLSVKDLGLDMAVLGDSHITLRALAKNLPDGAALESQNNRLVLKLPALPKPTTFTLAVDSKAAAEAKPGEEAEPLLARVSHLPTVDFDALLKTDTSRWGDAVATKGVRGVEKGAFALDSLTLPDDLPHKSWLRLTGVDFFADGRAAVCTLNGDVWIVSGIDANLEKLSWKRFATGLFEPLGLRVVDEKVYVLGRDQITRLHDRNGDGEADFYENLNNDGFCSASYGGFAMDLITDAAGNFYYSRGHHHNAEDLPLNGGVYRVSKDGSKLEELGRGMRVPNGLGVSPTGEITFGDNQGNYVPSSKISIVTPKGFYGFLAEPDPKKVPEKYDPPLLWLPMAYDSSSGSQEWVPADVKSGWNVLNGRMLHLSYGRAKMLSILRDGANPLQAASSPLPLAFETGVMRGRFNPKDGEFYTVGLGGGWQAGAPKHGAFNRVRVTGKALPLPIAYRTRANGMEITFAQTLNRAEAEDAESYSAEQWNYVFSAAYGSPEFSVADPKKKGRDAVEIKAAKLSPDGKTVSLEIPGLAPVMQFRVQYKLSAADGSPLNGELCATIHTLK